MINDEFLVKIETIIEYLEKNGGYNYKCPNSNIKSDFNIVEYAKDIRDYWKSIKYNKDLETYIKLEICKILMDNLELFALDDSKLIKLKEYCRAHIEEPIVSTPYEILMEFVHEALSDLLSASYLYDFRDME